MCEILLHQLQSLHLAPDPTTAAQATLKQEMAIGAHQLQRVFEKVLIVMQNTQRSPLTTLLFFMPKGL